MISKKAIQNLARMLSTCPSYSLECHDNLKKNCGNPFIVSIQCTTQTFLRNDESVWAPKYWAQIFQNKVSQKKWNQTGKDIWRESWYSKL